MPSISSYSKRPARRPKRASDDGLMMKIRLNPDEPKELRIIEALAACGQRGMSRFLKRAAYQLATGLDYDTDLPLYGMVAPIQAAPVPANRSERDLERQRVRETLATLDAGLDDWQTLSN